jgi:hypothetical protein
MLEVGLGGAAQLSELVGDQRRADALITMKRAAMKRKIIRHHYGIRMAASGDGGTAEVAKGALANVILRLVLRS